MNHSVLVIFLFLLSNNAYPVSFLDEKSDTSVKTTKKEKIITDKISRKSSGRKKLSSGEFTDELSKRNQLYDSQISKKMDAFYSQPIVIENFHRIRSLDIFNGVLNDSLVLTDSPSEVIVTSKENGGPLADSKLRCKGSVFLQRVKIYCDLLVTQSREIPVRVLIREKFDGASTILPDKFYTGEEARFIKQSFASFFGGVIDGSKDRALTLSGEQEIVNSKNKVYDGLFSVADNAAGELKREANTVQVAAVVNSGREVRIEFLEGVKNE